MRRIWSRWIAAAVVASWAVSVASADLPLPRTFKYVDPRVQFAGVEKYTDQVFLLKYSTGKGDPMVYDVKDSDPIDLSADKRVFDMRLFAVKRDVYDKNKDDPKKDWLSKETPGILEASVDPPSVAVSSKLREVTITRYRVEIGKLKGENSFSLTVTKQGAQKKQSDSSSSLMPPWVIGLVLALCMAAFGQWFVRRRMV